ncbi:MAG: DUF1329 domain-containing protein [Proteobacteria bacterium]|nr:DUF1329 domain-containing protein [Pseudomonadota bacterium]
MKYKLIGLSLVAALLSPAAQAVTDAEIDASFLPYEKGVPTFADLKPGTVINKDNVDKYKDVLDAATLSFIKKGWHDIEVGPTQSIAYDKNYIAATKKNANQVKIGAKLGTIEGYVAGRPFPAEPDIKDPRAGEKLAFNYKYGMIAGDSERIYPFYWYYRDFNSGKLERTIQFDFRFINFMHRVSQQPVPDIQPNPAKLYRGVYAKVLAPLDVKDTQILIHRYDDDTKADDAWLYLGFQRRVRRLSMSNTTDSFLGSDLMIEDFEGLWSRVSDFTWTYKGTANILLPMYHHSELKKTDFAESDGYKHVTFGGKSDCFFNVPWSLRKTYILEAVPTDPASPVGKRVLYLDSQTSVFPQILIYDKKGELWKRWTVGFSDSAYHASANKNAGMVVYSTAAMTDVQSNHCTNMRLHAIIDAKLVPKETFNVQNLRGD